eukprot:NODE_55_length_26219_cov_0.194908.p15 type:complete len:171 gc:universal NODE_55_length_26219_cov_0.194908:5030-5542(+)
MNMYKIAMSRNPFLTQCGITGVLLGSGDVLAQQLEKDKPYSGIRTLKMTAFGLIAVGPVIVTWMNLLDKVRLANTYTTLAARLALDQFAFTPFSLTGFFTGMSLMEGHTLEKTKLKLKEKFTDTLKTSWMVWIPVQSLNLSLVPVQHRPAIIQIVALGWNTFLSYTNYKD